MEENEIIKDEVLDEEEEKTENEDAE